MNRKITEYLQKVGLSEIEAKLYSGLLETGQTTIMELARHVDVKRITAHFNIERLIEMGLVVETRKGSKRYILAEDPNRIMALLDQQESKIADLRNQFPSFTSAMNEITKKGATDMSDVGILYYEGEQGFRNVCQRSLELARKEVRFISDLSEWHKVYTEEYDQEHYIPLRLERNLQLKMLVPESAEEHYETTENKKLDREIRAIPGAFSFKTTMIIYGQEVSILLSVRPYSAVVIQNAEVAKTFKLLFEQLWKVSNQIPV